MQHLISINRNAIKDDDHNVFLRGECVQHYLKLLLIQKRIVLVFQLGTSTPARVKI